MVTNNPCADENHFYFQVVNKIPLEEKIVSKVKIDKYQLP